MIKKKKLVNLEESQVKILEDRCVTSQSKCIRDILSVLTGLKTECDIIAFDDMQVNLLSIDAAGDVRIKIMDAKAIELKFDDGVHQFNYTVAPYPSEKEVIL